MGVGIRSSSFAAADGSAVNQTVVIEKGDVLTCWNVLWYTPYWGEQVTYNSVSSTIISSRNRIGSSDGALSGHIWMNPTVGSHTLRTYCNDDNPDRDFMQTAYVVLTNVDKTAYSGAGYSIAAHIEGDLHPNSYAGTVPPNGMMLGCGGKYGAGWSIYSGTSQVLSYAYTPKLFQNGIAYKTTVGSQTVGWNSSNSTQGRACYFYVRGKHMPGSQVIWL